MPQASCIMHRVIMQALRGNGRFVNSFWLFCNIIGCGFLYRNRFTPSHPSTHPAYTRAYICLTRDPASPFRMMFTCDRRKPFPRSFVLWLWNYIVPLRIDASGLPVNHPYSRADASHSWLYRHPVILASYSIALSVIKTLYLDIEECKLFRSFFLSLSFFPPFKSIVWTNVEWIFVIRVMALIVSDRFNHENILTRVNSLESFTFHRKFSIDSCQFSIVYTYRPRRFCVHFRSVW